MFEIHEILFSLQLTSREFKYPSFNILLRTIFKKGALLCKILYE